MTHETLSQAEHVINGKLGGVNAAARLLGHKNASTVQGWLKRGFIPPKRQPEVFQRARGAGIDINKSDFTVHITDAPQHPENAVHTPDPSHTEQVEEGVS